MNSGVTPSRLFSFVFDFCLFKIYIFETQTVCPCEDKFMKTNNRSLLDADKSSTSSFVAKPSVVVDGTEET